MIFNKEKECMPREQIEALQSEKLQWQVKRMYEKVEVFRKRMDEKGLKPSDIKSIKDLSKLPFSYKKDLRDFYPYGLFAVPMKDIVRVHASSGTTGKKIVVGYTKNDLEMWSECFARQLAAAGGTKDDFVQVCYGYGMFTGGLGAHDGATYLDTAYNTTRTIFEKATFLHSFTYETNGYGEYNYTYDEDWGDGTPHNVTYGYEVTGSVEYAGKEEKYYKDTKYTRPDDTDFTQAFDFTTNYRPYVYERDLANNKHEIRVNLYNADIIEGCGQYNDPYIIDSTAVFKSIADILNGTNYEIEIKLPIGLG